MMRRNRLTLLAAPLMALAFAACDNPVSEDIHSASAGVVLRAGATDVASAGAAVANVAVNLAPGAQTPQLTVHFLTMSGEVITPRSGYYLEVASSNPAVANWVPSSEGAFSGRIVAGAAGSAGLEFRYMHGRVGRGHPDARFNINVVVLATASNNPTGDTR